MSCWRGGYVPRIKRIADHALESRIADLRQQLAEAKDERERRKEERPLGYHPEIKP